MPFFIVRLTRDGPFSSLMMDRQPFDTRDAALEEGLRRYRGERCDVMEAPTAAEAAETVARAAGMRGFPGGE